MVRLADPQLADRRRRQIMDAAIACFRRRGFHQSTMAEICGEAEMSAGALYRYFPSKADIIGAIAEDKCNENDAAFLQIAEREGFHAALDFAARAALSHYAEGDGGLVAEIVSESIRDEAIHASLRKADKKTTALYIRAIKAAQKRGEVDSELNPSDAADSLLAILQGIGLRRAFLGQNDLDGALSQFHVLAQRFLSPRK